MSMGMRATGAITEIFRPRRNGMYTDRYTVWYENDMKRNFTIKGKMIRKHFDFIMNAKVERLEDKNGRHFADRFIVK